jgi:uncharacterized protein
MQPAGKKTAPLPGLYSGGCRVGSLLVTPSYVSLIVKEMNKLITDNQIAIKKLAKQHGIKTICLFGSMAKDDISDNSDVDFLVELEQGRDLFDLGELLMDLQALLQRKVDLVTKTSLHPRLYSQVLKEALPL